MIKINLLNQISPHAECYKNAFLLALSAHTKGNETYDHINRVGNLAIDFAKFMNLPTEEIQFISYGAYLHDVGKLSVRGSLITKPDKLTPPEWEEMRFHPIAGAMMARSVNVFPEDSCRIIEEHHERFDGKGYPQGLKGPNIYLGARMFSIIDAFDALTNNRCYRKQTTKDKALEEINSCSGSQFDPMLVSQFNKFIYV